MNINSVFSKHLKAEDLGTAKPVVTIDRVEVEKVGDETKPVLYFAGKDKGLVLNRTNSNTLIDLIGTSETDEWSGVRVQLFVTKVEFQGKRVPAIRIDAAPAPPTRTATRPAPAPVVAEPEYAEELSAEDIGF